MKRRKKALPKKGAVPVEAEAQPISRGPVTRSKSQCAAT